MTKTTDSLASAVASLGAVEVAPPVCSLRHDHGVTPCEPDPGTTRYAWPSCESENWFVGDDAALLHAHEPEPLDYGHFVMMPDWWSPERRFARRCTGRGVEGMRCGRIVEAFEKCGCEYAMGYYERITADLNTGAEIPA